VFLNSSREAPVLVTHPPQILHFALYFLPSLIKSKPFFFILEGGKNLTALFDNLFFLIIIIDTGAELNIVSNRLIRNKERNTKHGRGPENPQPRGKKDITRDSGESHQKMGHTGNYTGKPAPAAHFRHEFFGRNKSHD